MEARCKNCENTIHPEFEFCPKCSQKTALHRLSMHEVLHEAVHYFTHADKGLLQLVRDLTIKTGAVAREYAAGKRKKYFSPLNFFLISATLYVFVVNLDHTVHDRNFVLAQNPEVAQIEDPVQREKMITLLERRDKGIELLNKYSNTVSMLSLPLTMFFFWLCYCKGRYNYTEHLVAGMYMYGYTTLLFEILLLFNYLVKIPINYLFAFFFVVQTAYFVHFYYRFMEGHSAKQVAKALLVTMLSLFVMFAVSGVLMWLYMVEVIG